MSIEDLLNEFNVLVAYAHVMDMIPEDVLKNFEEIKKYINDNFRFNEDDKKIINDDLDFARERDRKNTIEDYIVSKFSEINKSLTLKEKVENIEKFIFLDNDFYLGFQDFLAKDEKQELLDNIDVIEPILFKLKRLLKATCYDSELLDYINSEGKNELLAMDAYLQKLKMITFVVELLSMENIIKN